MLAAVKVFNSLLVLLAHIGSEIALICLVVMIKVWIRLQTLLKVHPGQQRILSHHFVQNVEIEGELVYTLAMLE